MKVEIDLPEWVAAALLRWQIPPEHCGPDLADRLAFLADDMALHIERGEEGRKRNGLYKTFGLRHRLDTDDDAPPF